MTKRITSIITICFLTVISVKGQPNQKESLFAGIINFNSWIEKLDSQFDEFIKNERREECIRKLGYIGSDLEYITRLKQDFLFNVENENFAKADEKIYSIQNSTNELLDNIRDLDVLINDNFGKLGNDIWYKLENELIYEKRKMHSSILSRAKKKELDGLVNDTKRAIDLLGESSKLVWKLREDLMKKSE